jgi:phospholipid/cholesterol/gamma-HCH transport system substrate-binding protein
VPGQQEVRWSQLKVGVLVLVAVCALIALVFLMSGASGGFWSGHIRISSYFENSAGLKNGAPVNLDGVTVGNVVAIRIDLSKPLTPVEVVMKVNALRAKDIRADSKSSLETVGVLGDTVVDIDSRDATGPPVQNGAVLPTTETPNLQDVIQASQGTIQQLDTILSQVNHLVDTLNSQNGSIGMLINNRELYNKTFKTLNELSGIVDEINNGQGSIGKLLKDDTMYNRLNHMVAQADDITTKLNEGQGSAGKFLKDDTFYNELQTTTHNLEEITTTINSGKGSIGVLLKDQKVAGKLTDTVTQLDSLLNQINSGQGTIGQLMKNREMYDRADQTMESMQGLITAIRKNPKKYLTIHMKVF